jgi:predicted kinase
MSSTPPNTRSIKIGSDERSGWSSDRPRPGGGPNRPANISTRCRVLAPTDRLRYSPGSLVVIVSPSAAERDRFVARLIEDRSSLLSLAKVRALIAGRVPDEDVDARAAELLDATVQKRLAASDTVVMPVETLEAAEREPYVRMAAAVRRPRHIILVEPPRDEVAEEDRAALNELRRALDAGELGEEGFQTALRLGGGSVRELKRIIFRPPPKDD